MPGRGLGVPSWKSSNVLAVPPPLTVWDATARAVWSRSGEGSRRSAEGSESHCEIDIASGWRAWTAVFIKVKVSDIGFSVWRNASPIGGTARSQFAGERAV